MSQPKEKSRTDIIVSVILIVLGVSTILYSLSFPESDRSVGVSTFPRILAGIIIGLSILQIVMVVIKKDGGVPHPFRIPKRVLILIGASIGLVVIYIIIIKLLGFLLSTILFLVALVMLFGERSPLRIAIVSLSVTVAIYLVFHVLARVPFPEGVLEKLLHLT